MWCRSGPSPGSAFGLVLSGQRRRARRPRTTAAAYRLVLVSAASAGPSARAFPQKGGGPQVARHQNEPKISANRRYCADNFSREQSTEIRCRVLGKNFVLQSVSQPEEPMPGKEKARQAATRFIRIDGLNLAQLVHRMGHYPMDFEA